MATTLLGYDDFQGTAGTVLNGYVGERPGRYQHWSAHSGNSVSAVITSAGRVRANHATNGAISYLDTLIPPTANYEVEARFKVMSNAGVIGVWGRGLSSATTYYSAIYDQSSTRWQLRKLAAGAITSLGTSTATLVVNQEYVLSLRMNGSTIELCVDGAVLITVTDTTLTAVGLAGLEMQGFASDTTGYPILEYRVYSLDAERDITNALTITDVKLITDASAGIVKDFGRTLGLSEPIQGFHVLSERVNRFRQQVSGDGITAYGLRNTSLKSALVNPLLYAARMARADHLFLQMFAQMITPLFNEIRNSLPVEWSLGSITNMLDSYLMRLNGLSGTVKPTISAGWTPVATTGGGLPNMVAAEAPRIKFTYVGDNFWNESPPSDASAQVAITGGNTTYKISASAVTVPAGVTLIRVYMQRRGASATEAYGWVGDYAVTESAVSPEIVLETAFNNIRWDINPPSWLQCMVPPDLAMLMSYALGQAGGGSTDLEQLVVSAASMMSPVNVLLHSPWESFLGQGNPIDSMVFGKYVTTTYTQGSITTENNADLKQQGSAGARIIEAVVMKPINSAITPKINYKYYDESGGYGALTTTTNLTADAAFSGTDVGSRAVWTIPSNRLVREIHGVDFTGITSGEVWLTSRFVREY